MKTKIDSLNLSLFKGFKSTEVKFFSGLNLLVGGNNSGKSSVLHAIHLAFYFLMLTDGISETDTKRGIRDRLRGVTVKSIPLPFHDESYLAEGLKKRSKRDQATKIGITIKNRINFLETLTFPGGNLLVISSDNDGKAGNNSYQKEIKKIVRDDKSLPLFIPTFSGVANKEEIKMPAVVKHYLDSGRSSEVLRNQLKVLANDRNKFLKLNSYLKTSFGMEIISNDAKEIHLSSLYRESEYDNLDISAAGSGVQQILQILVYIVTSSANIVLIDEPDAHLHYKLQNVLYDILLEMAADGKQIIVATHSQIFIRRAVQHADRLILVNKKLPKQKAIEEYSEGLKLLYEEGIVDENEITQGGSLKLIDIEDAEGGVGFNVLKEWLYRLGVREPQYKLTSNDEHIFGYLGGKSKTDKIVFQSLILRDSDSLAEDYLKVIENKKLKENLSLVHWRVHEVENYLLQAKAVEKVLKSKGIKRVGAGKIKKVIQEIVDRNKDNLFDKMFAALMGKLQKHHLLLNLKFVELSTVAQDRQREIREKYLSYPFEFLPGKEIFNLLKQEIHQKYRVSISEIEVAKAFSNIDIPLEIKKAIAFFKE